MRLDIADPLHDGTRASSHDRSGGRILLRLEGKCSQVGGGADAGRKGALSTVTGALERVPPLAGQVGYAVGA